MQQLTYDPRPCYCDDCEDTIAIGEPFYASIGTLEVYRRCISCDEQRLEDKDEDTY